MATGKASGCAATQRRGSQLCNLSRRGFLGGLGAVGALGLAGCSCPLCRGGDRNGKIALQLYSIKKYIGGVKDKDGKTVTSGVGLERALADVAKIGYKAVEFAGYYGFSGKQIKKMLDDNGLVACGSQVGGWRSIDGDVLDVRRFDGGDLQTGVPPAYRIKNNSRHGGGDFNLVAEMLRILRRNDPAEIRRITDEALQSHVIAFAAERSRLAGGQVVEIG